MKRVIVDHFGGPEVLRVVEDDVLRPARGEVRVRVLAAGVSFTDAQLRAGTYLGVPRPPFTPGYELVGVIEEVDPGLLAVALAGLRLYGTCSARDRAAVQRLGAVAIDYRTEDFLARVRGLTGDGVDVVLDGLGGTTSIRSFRALRPGGRLVVFGHYATLSRGHKSRRGWAEWYGATATVALWGLLDPRRTVMAYRIQRLRDSRQWLPVAGRRPARLVGGGPRNPQWFREDFTALLDLLAAQKIHPVVAERPALSDARRAHELLQSPAATGTLVLVP